MFGMPFERIKSTFLMLEAILKVFLGCLVKLKIAFLIYELSQLPFKKVILCLFGEAQKFQLL